MSAGQVIEIADRVAAERQVQGLPEQVEDHRTLGRIARLLVHGLDPAAGHAIASATAATDDERNV